MRNTYISYEEEKNRIFFMQQLRETRKVPPTNPSSEAVVCNHGITDGDRHTIHAVQRCMQ